MAKRRNKDAQKLRTIDRHRKIQSRFKELYDQQRLRYDDTVDKLADEFCMSKITIYAVLRRDLPPEQNTITTTKNLFTDCIAQQQAPPPVTVTIQPDHLLINSYDNRDQQPKPEIDQIITNNPHPSVKPAPFKVTTTDE